MNDHQTSSPVVVSPAASPPKAPVVNPVVLRDASNGNRDEMRELAEIYLVEADESMAKLAVAIQAGTAKEVWRLTHRLAGGSASFGMIGVVPPLRTLEQLSKQGQLDGAETLLHHASQQLESIRHWLHEHAILSENSHSSTTRA